MPISFPGSPSLNDETTTGGRTYTWNGEAWNLKLTSSGGGGGGGGSNNDVLFDLVGSTTYTGHALAGSATSASVWTIKRTVYTDVGAISSTATSAANVKWDDRLITSYS